MVFLLLVSILFHGSLTFFKLVGGIGVGEELKWHQLAHNQLISQQGLHFSPHSTAETIIKEQISGKLLSSGINDEAFASVYSEKTRMKKLMLIMNKSQETTVFGRRQKLISPMKLRPAK